MLDPGIEPRSPVCQAGVLTATLPYASLPWTIKGLLKGIFRLDNCKEEVKIMIRVTIIVMITSIYIQLSVARLN